MIRRPPRSTQGVSSAASDVYKRQKFVCLFRPSNTFTCCVWLIRHRWWLNSSGRSRPLGFARSLNRCGYLRRTSSNCWLMTTSCSASVQHYLLHVASLDVGISEVGVDSRFESVSPMRSKPSPTVLLSTASELFKTSSMKETNLSLGGGLVAVWRKAGRSGVCLLYTSPSPRDQRGSRMPSSA